jgi:hypothetical protein
MWGTNPVTSAAVMIVVVLLVAGSLLGMSLGETEVLNPFSAKGQLEDTQRQIQRQAQLDEIDIRYYKQERAKQAEVQKALYDQEIEFQRKQKQQALVEQGERHELQMKLSTMLAVVAALAALLVGVGLTFYLLMRGKQAQVQPQPVLSDPWASPEFRKQMRDLARVNECLSRQVREAERAKTDGDGHHDVETWDDPEVVFEWSYR